MKKRALMAWSSGKDSAWALHVLRGQADVEVVGLLTTLNGEVDRVAMHAVSHELLRSQAAAVELPLRTVALPSPCSNADYERLMAGAIATAVDEGITHMAFGDLFLEDVRAYRETQLEGSGIEPMFPIWGTPADTPTLARRMLDGGTRAIIVCVDDKQLDPAFLGREFDERLLADLPASVDPCAERGEFHTFCYDGPAFSSPVNCRRGTAVVSGQFHFLDLTRRA